MKTIFKYKLYILKGTLEYVLIELLNKYPNVKILKQVSDQILFEYIDSDINIFRNLYSPIGIENEKGIRLDLSKRDWRKKYVSAGINPSLAFVMCMLADLKESDIVYDPFCGSSVLGITCLKYFNVKRVICSDISSTAINKSKENFINADIDESRYMIFKSDIKDVHLNKRNIDLIVSNLPFGIRVGNHSENVLIYINLEKVADRVLRRKGRLILLTQEKKLLRDVFKKDKWRVKSMLRVDEGGLLPEVFKISRVK